VRIYKNKLEIIWDNISIYLW